MIERTNVLPRSLHPIDMGEQSLLRGRQGAQSQRQADRGGELRAGGQRVRPVSEQRAAAVAGKHERDAVAAVCARAARSLRAAEVDDAVVAAAVATVVGHSVHRQRHHVRQLRPIIRRPCEMPSLYLRAMGQKTLKRASSASTFAGAAEERSLARSPVPRAASRRFRRRETQRPISPLREERVQKLVAHQKCVSKVFR